MTADPTQYEPTVAYAANIGNLLHLAERIDTAVRKLEHNSVALAPDLHWGHVGDIASLVSDLTARIEELERVTLGHCR